jgi:hypothetical protein
MQESKNKNMMLLIKKWLPKIVVVVAIIAIGSVLFEKCSSNADHKAFLVEMDSLHKVNDSLFVEIEKDDAIIDSLNYVSEELTYKVEHQKTKVIKIIEIVEVEKNKIDTFTEHELISSFNTRYPKDTTTNPLPLAQPVLVAAAKDLVEFDGVKEIIILKDSTISTLEAKVVVKDNIITGFENKESKYKTILINKDKEIAGWEDQYNQIDLQLKKLKAKSKFQRIGSYIVIGGLGYLMLVK